ncbi:autotransporter outer membrane beta-barrel domain-containing protein [Microbulbifer guangxiensis]|uniref:autotransporter outer membrane beta-barrel domain-containing protein n=1 Tax=Microbulbifer guangxiensis TaxID=2904249 RepID=UPI00272DDCE6|nr:autotransporter domain-containing protein [Microbulbifer guangxiensis]
MKRISFCRLAGVFGLAAFAVPALGANCNASGKLIYVGATFDQTRSVWLSLTSPGSFGLQVVNTKDIVDQWSRTAPGPHISVSPVLVFSNGGTHVLLDLSGDRPCSIDNENQKADPIILPQFPGTKPIPPIGVIPPPDFVGITPEIPVVPPGVGVTPEVPVLRPPGTGITPEVPTLRPPGTGITPEVPTLRPPGTGITPEVPTLRPPGTGITPQVPVDPESPIGTLPPTGVMPEVPVDPESPIATVPPTGVTPTLPVDPESPISTLPPTGVMPEVPVDPESPIATLPPTGVTPALPVDPESPIGTLPPTGVMPEVPVDPESPIATLPPTGVTPTVPIDPESPIGTVPPTGVTPEVPVDPEQPVGKLPPTGITPQVPVDPERPIGTLPPEVEGGDIAAQEPDRAPLRWIVCVDPLSGQYVNATYAGNRVYCPDGYRGQWYESYDSGKSDLPLAARFTSEYLPDYDKVSDDWDVWSDVDHTELRDRRGDRNFDSNESRLSFGAHRKIAKRTFVGGAAAVSRYEGEGFRGFLETRSDRISIGPYFGHYLSNSLAFNSNLNYSYTETETALASFRGNSETDEWFFNIGLEGYYSWQEWGFQPQAYLNYSHAETENSNLRGLFQGETLQLNTRDTSSSISYSETSLVISRRFPLNRTSVAAAYFEFGSRMAFQLANDVDVARGITSGGYQATSKFSGLARVGAQWYMSESSFMEAEISQENISGEGLEVWRARLMFSHAF